MTEDELAVAERSIQTETWIRKYLAAVDSQDLATLNEMVDEECEFHDCRYESVIGKAALAEWGAGIFAGMADQKREQIIHLVSKDRVAIGEFEYTGRHVGDYMGFPGTGQALRWKACVIYTFNDEGRLIRQMYYNDAGALEEKLRGAS